MQRQTLNKYPYKTFLSSQTVSFFKLSKFIPALFSLVSRRIWLYIYKKKKKINFMLPLSAYSSGIFGITWSPPDPRPPESNAAKYFASVNPDWSAAFDFYIQNFKSSVATRSPQVIWALHRLSKLSFSIQHMAAKCIQRRHRVCERGGHKEKVPTNTNMREVQMGRRQRRRALSSSGVCQFVLPGQKLE